MAPMALMPPIPPVACDHGSAPMDIPPDIPPNGSGLADIPPHIPPDIPPHIPPDIPPDIPPGIPPDIPPAPKLTPAPSISGTSWFLQNSSKVFASCLDGSRTPPK